MIIIAMGWTLLWGFGPLIVAPFAIVWAGRWVNRRSSYLGWSRAWVLNQGTPEDPRGRLQSLAQARRAR